MSGQILRGRYQIVRGLSSGGFGQTFLAQDTDIPGNPVCVVKQLKPLSQTPAHLELARQLFEREAQKLTLLGSHAQIPQLLAYFKENNEFYLVQEYIEGHTLDAELPPGQRWTEAQVVDLLQQMLTVLMYVHDEGVIHRDIKPANIIRRKRDNKLVLIDFGAVKELAQPGGIPGEPMTVATGTQIGTAGYMPTEQGRGKPKPSSDLYALGMIGIQALTGRYPHQLEEHPNTGETVWQNLTQVSPGLAQVLTQMTRYHFKDRYQRAVEALQAVRQLAPASGTTPSGAARTVAATQMETVQELTLEWTEQGQTRSQIIRPQQPTKFPGRVRVGRDPAQCDIVLSNPTVSALHIEIVFDSQERFLVRNLRQNNPLYINGQPLSQGEAALHQGSVLRLGEAEVRVTSITQRQYPVGSVPSGSFPTPQPSSPQSVEPVAATVQGFQQSQSSSYDDRLPQSGQAQPQPTPLAPPSKKFPLALVLTLVASVLFVGVPLIVAPAFLNQASKAKEMEAKAHVGVMNRAQQAFYIEKATFSSSLPDLWSGLSINLPTSGNYTYQIIQVDEERAFMAAIATTNELRSFVGLVWLEPNPSGGLGEKMTFTILCRSSEPTQSKPSIPSSNDCPSGYVKVS